MTVETGSDTSPETAETELRKENSELARRLTLAEAALDDMRQEARQRRAEVRSLAESLPTAMSRHAVLRSMLSDARHHPDKAGVARRGIAKAGRAPRKAFRLIRDRV